ncbi:hypothetical protein D3C78_1345740 [compost metagenome]
MFKLKGNIGIFRRIFTGFINIHIAHVILTFAFFANQFSNGNRGVIQVRFSQKIHVMTSVSIDQVMSEHGVK